MKYSTFFAKGASGDRTSDLPGNRHARVETERPKHRSRAFRALKFSIRAISSTIFDFEFSIRAISSGEMVEHFEHKKISSNHRAISSINLEKIFEQNRAFFERNQTFFEHDRAESTVNTKFYKVFQVIGIVLYQF